MSRQGDKRESVSFFSSWSLSELDLRGARRASWPEPITDVETFVSAGVETFVSAA